MTNRPCRRYLSIAAGVAVLAVAAAPVLAGQGAQARRSVVVPAAPAAAEGSRLATARSVLSQLAGTWRFEIRFVGNLDGPADAAGTRVMTPLFDGLSLEWTEELDDSPIRGRGLIAFDPGSGQLMSTAVYSGEGGAEFTTGVFELGEPLITFRPTSPASDGRPDQQLRQSSALSILDANHFSWVALDRGWRGLFTRQPQ
jgi:hypothetical protein